jgi:hypothetical protein
MTDENRSSGAAGLEGQEPRQIELTFGDAEGDLSAGAGQSAADEQKGSFAAATPAAMTAEELMAAASKDAGSCPGGAAGRVKGAGSCPGGAAGCTRGCVKGAGGCAGRVGHPGACGGCHPGHGGDPQPGGTEDG